MCKYGWARYKLATNERQRRRNGTLLSVPRALLSKLATIERKQNKPHSQINPHKIGVARQTRKLGQMRLSSFVYSA